MKREKIKDRIRRELNEGLDALETAENYSRDSLIDFILSDRKIQLEKQARKRLSISKHGLEGTLFNHGFARALFGDKDAGIVGTRLAKYCQYLGDADLEFYDFEGKLYFYHIMCAVVSKDPIDYYYQQIVE